MITIASTCGQPSCSRRRGRTPGPQSSSTRPDPSTRYPDCAPPGFGHAGEQPTTVNFTSAVWHSPHVAAGAADLLKRVPIFSDLDAKELERIASSMKERTFRAGDTVTTEGKSGVGFFVIDSGAATVTIGGEERRKLGAGDYFGEVALAQREPTHRHHHRRLRPQVLRNDVLGVPAARGDPRLHRLEVAPGDVEDVPVAFVAV